MSEDLLWVHMRAGVSLFRRLLADEFEQNLSEVLPGRVIPVSASPPSDLGLFVENELQGIKDLLAAGRRRTAEAAARLRPLLSLDGSATGRTDQPTDTEVRRAERAIRAGADWRKVLPGLASLSIAQATPNSDAQEVVLRVGKGNDAVPVRRARLGEEAEALAYRGVSPFEEYGIKLSEFGEKLGLGVNEGYAIIDASTSRTMIGRTSYATQSRATSCIRDSALAPSSWQSRHFPTTSSICRRRAATTWRRFAPGGRPSSRRRGTIDIGPRWRAAQRSICALAACRC